MGHDFLGKRFVEESQNAETERWWGLKYLGKGPLPRPGKAVAKFSEAADYIESPEIIGYVTSGGPSPSLGRIGIGMAYLSNVTVGDKVNVLASPRKMVEAIIVQTPFI